MGELNSWNDTAAVAAVMLLPGQNGWRCFGSGFLIDDGKYRQQALMTEVGAGNILCIAPAL